MPDPSVCTCTYFEKGAHLKLEEHLLYIVHGATSVHTEPKSCHTARTPHNALYMWYLTRHNPTLSTPMVAAMPREYITYELACLSNLNILLLEVEQRFS
jgi:hypothetical protein